MEEKKYRVFVENLDTGNTLCQGLDNEWYTPTEIREWNLYTETEATSYCQGRNTGIYALHKGLHYFFKEYHGK